MKKQILMVFLGVFLSPAYGQDRLVFSSIVENDHARLACTEVLGTALNRLNINLAMNPMPAARSLFMSNKGITDGELARIKGLQVNYPNLSQLEVSCFSHDVYLYVKTGNEFKVNGWDSIPKDYVLGYRNGLQFIEDAAQKHEFAIYPLVNLDQVLGLLIVGRIDIMVATKQLFELTGNIRQSKQITMLEPAIERHDFYSYLHKKNLHILPKLNKILVSMQISGEIELIKQKQLGLPAG